MSVLHVVSHPDDDLLFMSPDLATTVRSGSPSVTLFLTAGQLTGAGSTDGQRARSRQRGIQDAYAVMAGLTPEGDQSEWTGDLFNVNGKLLERYSLNGTDVHVVFAGLRDGQLSALYAGTPHLTVITTDGLGAPQYGYNKADVINMIRTVVSVYEPGEVRSLDPLPETRYTPQDHPDHTTAAKLVAGAVTTVPVVAYRGYGISALPVDLAPEVAADKLAAFEAYAVYDPQAQDLSWTDRMYYRWPRGTSWVGRNADGRLQVFTVNQGKVVTWWQLAGGGWSQPQFMAGAGGPLAPTLSIGYDADGRMELVARRLSDHRILVNWQTAPNAAWASTWADLGNHNAGMSNADQMGSPAVGRYADGRLVVFVKNGGGGVSCKAQSRPGEAFVSGWTDLGGTDVQDGLTVVTDVVGRVHLFASTTTGLLHWTQPTVNDHLLYAGTLPSVPPASPPTAAVDPDGRILVAYRADGGQQVAVTAQDRLGGLWLQPTTAPGPGGTGQLAAAVWGGAVHVAGRDADDAVSVCEVNNGIPGAWLGLGGQTDCPALAADGCGNPVVFTAGASARPACYPWPTESAWTELP